MCRFALYMGPAIRMASLVTEPEHSIIKQSYHSQERDEPLNGDGFGVAWYTPDDGDEPAVFKSISPAWNNANLFNISRVVDSSCILAHVRAASPGLPVTRLNCHPFAWRRFTFMHNGEIGDYRRVRRPLGRMLSDETWAWRQGSTDSESIFGLFIDSYQELPGSHSVQKMAQAMLTTIDKVESLVRSAGSDRPCYLNLVATDGRLAVATRYSTPGSQPASLHLHTDARYSCESGNVQLAPCEHPTVLVASEALTHDESWVDVEPNHMVLVDDSLQVCMQPIRLA